MGSTRNRPQASSNGKTGNFRMAVSMKEVGDAQLRQANDTSLNWDKTMRVTQDDALSLLNKYAEERTPVRAVFVTPSRTVARVTGTIHVSIDRGVPVLLVGREDSEPDQIKFRLTDCLFEYGDFREEPADKFEAFLVVGSSKGDTLSLFEAKG